MPSNQFRFLAVTVVFFVACSASNALEELPVFVVHLPSPQEQLEQKHRQTMIETINHINAVCVLTDRQKRKLTVASKGAVERAMAKWKQASNPSRRPGVQLGDIDRDGLIEQVEVRVLGQQRVEALVAVGLEVWVFQPVPKRVISVVTKESIWTKTLAKVLTAKQHAKLKASKKNGATQLISTSRQRLLNRIPPDVVH